MKLIFRLMLCLAVAGLSSGELIGDVLTFESLPSGVLGFYNGDTTAGSPFRDNYTIIGTADNFGSVEYLQLWTAGGVEFNNNYTPDFDSWTSWSWSAVADNQTAGFGNQFAAYSGGGSDGLGGIQVGGTYAVASGQGAYFNLPTGTNLNSVDLTNTTYAGLSMRDGDDFAKKFGGVSGNDADFFRVTLTGFDALSGLGNIVSAITVTLADFTFADNSQDYILDTWLNVDLTSLTGSRSIQLSFESSDVGAFGINTPLYVAMDNLSFSTSAVPEPGSFAAISLLSAGFAAGWYRKRRRLPTI